MRAERKVRVSGLTTSNSRQTLPHMKPPKTKRIAVRLTTEQYRWFVQFAKRMDCNLTEALEWILTETQARELVVQSGFKK